MADSDSEPDMDLGDMVDQDGQPFDEAAVEPNLPGPGFNIRSPDQHISRHALEHGILVYNGGPLGMAYQFSRADLDANAVRHDAPHHFMHHNGSYSSVHQTTTDTNQMEPIDLQHREIFLNHARSAHPDAHQNLEPQPDEGRG